MKKLLLIGMLAAVVATSSQAQATWNARAGMSVSRVSISGSLDDITSMQLPNARVGAYFGVGVEFPISKDKKWFVEPSLMFAMKGYKANPTLEGYEFDESVRSNYIELPVMAGLRLPVGKEMYIVMRAGPYFAVGVGGKAKLGYKNQSLEYDVFKKEKYESDGITPADDSGLGAKRFDMGIYLGAAFEYKQFFVELNGGMAFTKFIDMAYLTSTDVVRRGSRNSVSYIGVGYKF
jgi:hypothetical protein